MWDKRFEHINLTSLQRIVNEKRVAEFWKAKRKEYPDPQAFREFRDSVNINILNPKNVSEEDALNEVVPSNYRMVSRDSSFSQMFGTSVTYLFERKEES